MNRTDFLDFIKNNDVKFIRLAFADFEGKPKNISVMAENVSAALSGSVTFDGTEVFAKKYGSLHLFPDTSTVTFLPWRPDRGRVVRAFCEIKCPDGSPFPLDTRTFLKDVDASVKARDILASLEFVFIGENSTPLDFGTLYDLSPLDRGEDLRREICLNLEAMGILPAFSHHGKLPGQNVVALKHASPPKIADAIFTLKTIIATTAERNGLTVSFEECNLKLQLQNSKDITLKPAFLNPYIAVSSFIAHGRTKDYLNKFDGGKNLSRLLGKGNDLAVISGEQPKTKHKKN